MDTYKIIRNAVGRETKLLQIALRRRGWTCSLSLLYQWMSEPADVTRRDPVRRFVEFLDAVNEVSPEGAAQIWEFTRARYFGKPVNLADLNTLIAKTIKEDADVLTAHTMSLPLAELRRETVEAIAAKRTLLANLELVA